MKALIGLGIAFAVASACSSSDQSLGETRATPQPEVNPDPPDPMPEPNPNPDAPLGPCEDPALHEHVGSCLLEPLPCPGDLITRTGYECPVGLRCCVEGSVGCGPNGEGCGGAESGPVLPPGGFGGDG